MTEVNRQIAESTIVREHEIVIHDVRLGGAYPETKLIVDLERLERRDELEWGLWGRDWGVAPTEPVNEAWIARDVMIQIWEF